LVPQNAQNASDPSTFLPQDGHCASPAPSGAYTLVAGTGAAPAADARWPAAAIAEADSGLPQSMQNREPSSLRRPQWAHISMEPEASARVA
jgi:hypothetical protein